MTWLKRLCPHRFGWSYNTHRRRRWCRLCGQQQRNELPISDRARSLYDQGDLLEAQKEMLANVHWANVP